MTKYNWNRYEKLELYISFEVNSSTIRPSKLFTRQVLCKLLTNNDLDLYKSSITFGDKVEENVKAEIHNKLGIRNVGGAISYLGLPECFSGSKLYMLNFIKERIKERFSKWFSRVLSQGGKEVVMKSVAKGWMFLQWVVLNSQNSHVTIYQSIWLTIGEVQ